MAGKFLVVASILHRIEHSAGFKDDGTPKKVVEHKRGDVVDFPGYEDEQLHRLVELRAIRPVSDEEIEEAKKRGDLSPQQVQFSMTPSVDAFAGEASKEDINKGDTPEDINKSQSGQSGPDTGQKGGASSPSTGK